MFKALNYFTLSQIVHAQLYCYSSRPINKCFLDSRQHFEPVQLSISTRNWVKNTTNYQFGTTTRVWRLIPRAPSVRPLSAPTANPCPPQSDTSSRPLGHTQHSLSSLAPPLSTALTQRTQASISNGHPSRHPSSHALKNITGCRHADFFDSMPQHSVYRPRPIMLPFFKQSSSKRLPRSVTPTFAIYSFFLILFFLVHTCSLSDKPSTVRSTVYEQPVVHPTSDEKGTPHQAVDEAPQSAPVVEQHLDEERHSVVANAPPPKFCDLPGDCVFDLGHNNGQDTKLYLDAPNTRVVAVEANPVLVEESRRKFHDAIRGGRLKLIGIGLVDSDDGGARKSFWVNKNSKFSSFLEHLGCRDGWGNIMPSGDHTYCHSIELDIRSCRDLMEEFGTPVYLKIDIEGLDRVCMESVSTLHMDKRPRYLSVENVQKHIVERLAELGYKGFKAVNQAKLELGTSLEMRGHSGPWGEDAVDDLTGTKWQTKEEILRRLPLNDTFIVNGEPRVAWYDLHASRPV